MDCMMKTDADLLLGEPAKVGLANDGQCHDNMYGRILTQDQLLTLAAHKGAGANNVSQSVVVSNDFVATLTNKNNNQARINATFHHKYRDPANGPLLKLSVNLIKTYKHINEVSVVTVHADRLIILSCPALPPTDRLSSPNLRYPLSCRSCVCFEMVRFSRISSRERRQLRFIEPVCSRLSAVPRQIALARLLHTAPVRCLRDSNCISTSLFAFAAAFSSFFLSLLLAVSTVHPSSSLVRLPTTARCIFLPT